jgi:DNA-binding LytR/AlgR family response regulator
MKVLLVEDETPAAKRLIKILTTIDHTIEIVQQTDSIESTVKYLHTLPQLDLIFMDIQLADGISFAIFEQITITTPVIFTTAFDEYTLKAFKVNSVDYLLKPIDEIELQQAIVKYKKIHIGETQNFSTNMEQLLRSINQTKYKERLLIKRGQQLSYLKLENTAFCYADGKLCFAIDFEGNKFLLENNLSQLEEQLQPSVFFRINRHLLINIETIKKVHTWLGGRLKLELNPTTNIDTLVSRERVAAFKEWLGQ